MLQKVMAAIILPALLVSLLTVSLNIKAGKRVYADLSINKKTATCLVSIATANISDSIEVSVVLAEGSNIVGQWDNITGTGTLYFNESVSVDKGKTYTMKTVVKINGTTWPVSDISKKAN